MAKQPTELAFWRDFISDLFLGTFKRLFFFSMLGSLIGLCAFYVLNYVLPWGVDLLLPVKWLILFLSFLWFTFIGFTNGLVYSVLYTTGKKFDELRDGIQVLLDLLMNKALGYIPGTESAITTKQFEGYMERVITEVTTTSKKEFSLFSFVGIPARLLLRGVLKSVKFAVKTQTIDKLEERGEMTLSVQTVENQVRRELAGLVLSRYRDVISTSTYLLWGEFILLFGLPFGVFFLFKVVF